MQKQLKLCYLRRLTSNRTGTETYKKSCFKIVEDLSISGLWLFMLDNVDFVRTTAPVSGALQDP